MDVQVQELSNLVVASMAQFEGLQASIEAALLFIQEAEEQNNGRPQFLGGRRAQRSALQDLGQRVVEAAHSLALAPVRFGGQVNINPTQLLAVDLPAAVESQERRLDLHMQLVLQLGGGEAGLGLLDPMGCGLEQVAVAGEPATAVRPKALGVELRQGVQGVEFAPVGVTGAVAQGFELAKDRHRGGGAQGLFQLRQAGRPVLAQEVA